MHTCSWYVKCECSALAFLQVFSKHFQRNITVLCIGSNKNLPFYLLIKCKKLIQSYYTTVEIVANIRKCSKLIKVTDILSF